MWWKYLPFVLRFIKTYRNPTQFQFSGDLPYYKLTKPGTVCIVYTGFEWVYWTKFVCHSGGWVPFESNKDKVLSNPKYLAQQDKLRKDLKSYTNDVELKSFYDKRREELKKE